MNRIPDKLQVINESLKELSSKNTFDHCQKVVNSTINLLGISGENNWQLFTDSQGKIKRNATWFMMAEGFADRRASYKVADGNDSNIDVKVFWMKNLSKSIISWLTALTPNFEDEPFNTRMNIGIDFIIPESTDRIIVVLSNNYIIRTLELQDSLNNTHLEIFAKWLSDFDFSNKKQVHQYLWDSFDLESVNKDFYKGISERFVHLKQHLVNKGVFDDKHAAIFTNRLIGRIVFCWFLDKKGIINPKMKYFDTEGSKATEYYHVKLETLFFRVFNTPKDERSGVKTKGSKQLFPETDPKNLFNANIDIETPFLNGGLFEEKDDEKENRFRLDFPADYFDDLYTFLRHYNFTTDESTSTFQQVAIDPEMLGRIFENLLAEQIEETGEQARKAKGAFYTPREIVDYMCRESLREYLKSKLPNNDERDSILEKLLDKKAHEYRDQQTNYKRDIKPYKNDIIEALDNLKVIDPACGSGAFPMGMLQLLLQCYERIEPRFDPKICKLSAIKNNIYGVDIEPMAVEISRLRAWLSIVVDESSDPKPLPNLDFKFVCANSLIPVPEEKELTLTLDPFFEKLENAIGNYFTASEHDDKDPLKNQIKDLIDAKVKEKYKNVLNLGTKHTNKTIEEHLKNKNKKALEKNTELMELWSSYLNIFTSDKPVGFFEPRYFFPSAKIGFDIVIANPPYVEHKKLKAISKALKDNYSTYSGTADLYVYFYELGFKLLSKEGVLTFISSNKFIKTSYGKTLRALLSSYKLKIILDFTELKVFEALVASSIIISTKSQKDSSILVSFVNNELKTIGSIEKYIAQYHLMIPSESLGEEIWQLMDDNKLDIKSKIEQKTTKIINIEGVSVYRGVTTGCNKAFIIKNEVKERLIEQHSSSKEIIKPLLQGRDIRKWYHKKSTKYLIFTKRGINITNYPAIKKHLEVFRDDLEPGTGRKPGAYQWYEIQDNTAYFNEFEKEKIIWGLTADKWAFTYDRNCHYLPSNGYILTSEKLSLKYLLAILNSNLIKFYFDFIGIMTAGGAFTLKRETIYELPIRINNLSNQSTVETLVDQILSITNSSNYSENVDSQAKISEIENNINKIIYDIYELSIEDINLIEESCKGK